MRLVHLKCGSIMKPRKEASWDGKMQVPAMISCRVGRLRRTLEHIRKTVLIAFSFSLAPCSHRLILSHAICKLRVANVASLCEATTVRSSAYSISLIGKGKCIRRRSSQSRIHKKGERTPP